MKAITVCVEFDDLLALTLPRNIRHFADVLVVTSPDDARTQSLARACGAGVFTTDAFYRHGAAFNKGLAIEEALDNHNREGWIATIDADIILPEIADLTGHDPEYLYGANRRICRHSVVPEEASWKNYPLAPDGEIPGCFQLFHASASVLKERPWFGTDWKHAGGYDSVFEAKFRPGNTRWLPFEILHLGEGGVNWCGRVTPRLDGIPVRGQAEHEHAMREVRRLRHVNRNMDHERLTRPYCPHAKDST